MDLLKIFSSDGSGVRRSHLKNLISVAMADGQMDDEEWQLLRAVAELMEISDEEVETIRNNPDKIHFMPPRKYEDKVQQIRDLVAIMAIDGHINHAELDLCKKISVRLDILPQLVDQILADFFGQEDKAGSDTP